MTKLSLKQFMLVVALWPVFVLGLAGLAPAEVKDFGVYTIDIPLSWKISNVGEVMVLTSPDRKAAILITQGISQGPHEKIVAKLQNDIKLIGSPSPNRLATITVLRWSRVVVSIMGDHADRVDIYRSIKAKPKN